MENPEEDTSLEISSAKGRKSNAAMFFYNNPIIKVSIEEHHFRKVRDEQAFLAKMRENMGS